MAIALRNVSSITGTGTLSVAKPTGVVANDVLVLCFNCDDNPSSITLPSGFTQLDTGLSTADENTYVTAWKLAGGSEPSSYSVSRSGGANGTGDTVLAMLAYSGCDTTTPINQHHGTTNSTNNATPVTASDTGVTTTVNGCQLLFLMAPDNTNGAASSISFTPPTGFSNQVTAQSGMSWASLEVADKSQTTQGATGSVSGTWTGGGGWSASVIALAPSGGGTQSFSYTASGGLTFGGTATRSMVRTKTGAGGLVFGGTSAEVRKVTEPSPSGGVVFGGSSAFAKGKIVTPSGGLILGGTASPNRIRQTAAPTGGIVFGGSAPESSSGIQTRTVTPSGGIILSGAAALLRKITIQPSGGLQLGGSAPYSNSGVVSTAVAYVRRFLHNLGRRH